ncbi:hypothetical protein PVK06_017085 [Gossypium arboreum]|uniref:CLAVATA3/ESR (CLE)-related protein 45 n=1 Tax=Gossypium arboreum TaxID=29729 RepID=A0ABR0Q1T5_GOSAR|nr:hypothetical protein PVK06_017085 [Gossypium arboreum]
MIEMEGPKTNEKKKLGFSNLKVKVAPDKASGLISIDLVFRHGQGEDQIAIRTNQRILKAADMKGTRTEKKLPEVVNNTFDPNRSSKRRVRRGPDPIHNRS